MTTKIIGIREFRQNITKLWKEACDQKIRYIVLYHSKPILEVNPLGQEDVILENLIEDVSEARTQIKKGKTHTHDQMLKELS